MAIVAPVFVTATYGSDETVTLTIPADTTGWTMTASMRPYEGAAATATKTVGAGITNTPGASSSTVAITFSATDNTQPPGLRVWDIVRTNVGYNFPIADVSGYDIAPSTASPYPRLTNLSEYVSALGLSTTVADVDAKALLLHLAGAEAALKRACNREFVYASRTAYLASNWHDCIVLPETPVESITSLYWDLGAFGGQNADDFAATTLLTLGDDYFLDRDRGSDSYSNSGRVFRIGGVWTGGYRRNGTLSVQRVPAPGTIRCVFTGGYGNAVRVPVPLKLAIFEAATIGRKAALDGRLITSESGEGESFSYGPVADEVKRLNSVQQVINSYRRPVV